MFGDPVSGGSAYRRVKLGQLCIPKAGIKAGPFGSSIKKEEYITRGYRVYGQEQVIGGTLSIGDYYISEGKFRTLESCAVAAGDVLVSLVGSFGRVLVVPSKFELGIINPRLLRLRPDQRVARSSYIQALLESVPVQHVLRNKSRGGTMGILNAGLLKDLDVVQPPLDVQDKFEEQVMRLQSTHRTLAVALGRATSMFSSLQDFAFSGQL
jgi:type I restriction enzyme S subunit